MEPQSPIRILVLSDLHAFVNAKWAGDSFTAFGSSVIEARNPLVALQERARELIGDVDAVICPGDICNKADIGGFERAWAILQRLKDELRAKSLIATCGNHDLNSRHLYEGALEEDPDPKGALLSLHFPFGDNHLTDRYWSRNFALHDIGDDARAVVLNTSAYHGWKDAEIDHGRVSDRTMKAIEAAVRAAERREINILVCHHHLTALRGYEGRTDYEYVRKGQELLDRLSAATHSSWLVIHGHRHLPHVIYGGTSSSHAPVVIGAGSLGARVPGVPNQIHLVQVKRSSAPEHLTLVGTVKTLEWTESNGWNNSSGASAQGMPAECGFGHRGQIWDLAQRIDTFLHQPVAEWSAVVAAIPSLVYLTHSSLMELVQSLKSLGINFFFDEHRQPAQIGRPQKP